MEILCGPADEATVRSRFPDCEIQVSRGVPDGMVYIDGTLVFLDELEGR